MGQQAWLLVVLPLLFPCPVLADEGLKDLNPLCEEWAQEGNCEEHTAYMAETCAKSCASVREDTKGHPAKETLPDLASQECAPARCSEAQACSEEALQEAVARATQAEMALEEAKQQLEHERQAAAEKVAKVEALAKVEAALAKAEDELQIAKAQTAKAENSLREAQQGNVKAVQEGLARALKAEAALDELQKKEMEPKNTQFDDQLEACQRDLSDLTRADTQKEEELRVTNEAAREQEAELQSELKKSEKVKEDALKQIDDLQHQVETLQLQLKDHSAALLTEELERLEKEHKEEMDRALQEVRQARQSSEEQLMSALSSAEQRAMKAREEADAASDRSERCIVEESDSQSETDKCAGVAAAAVAAYQASAPASPPQQAVGEACAQEERGQPQHGALLEALTVLCSGSVAVLRHGAVAAAEALGADVNEGLATARRLQADARNRTVRLRVIAEEQLADLTVKAQVYLSELTQRVKPFAAAAQGHLEEVLDRARQIQIPPQVQEVREQLREHKTVLLLLLQEKWQTLSAEAVAALQRFQSEPLAASPLRASEQWAEVIFQKLVNARPVTKAWLPASACPGDTGCPASEEKWAAAQLLLQRLAIVGWLLAFLWVVQLTVRKALFLLLWIVFTILRLLLRFCHRICRCLCCCFCCCCCCCCRRRTPQKGQAVPTPAAAGGKQVFV